MRVLSIWALYVLLVLLLIGFTSSEYVDEELATHNYDRLDEARKACSKIIPSASELKLDDNGIDRIKKKLSFLNGDWEQQGTSAPLMPFVEDSRERRSNLNYGPSTISYPQSPYKLVSFTLTDVSTAHQSKRTVGVNGYLVLVITSDLPLAILLNKHVPEFSMWEGHSVLFINFQGIYAESKKDGESVLCLLGNTMLPSRQSESTDPWELVKASISRDEPLALLQDDQILLVLKYPKTASLKHRAIEGEMRSLNSKDNLKYFDKVQITSQLQVATHDYEFSPDEIVSKACDPYPYNDTLVSGVTVSETYKGLDFCKTLKQVSTDAAFVVAPHWRCNGTDEFCRGLGPFGSDKEINATDGSFKDIRIVIQNLLCVSRKTQDNVVTARVSAIFRAFDAPSSPFIEVQRTGLDNMALVAEGIWNSSSGQLCMIGCLGIMDVEGGGCDTRICLYIPISFSITQRSLLVGSISSVLKNNPSYFPLSLKMLYESLDYISDSYVYAHPYYHYSKIDAAGVVLEKNEPFSFETVIKKSWLTFPKLENSEDYAVSLRLLAEDLTLHVSAVPDPIPRSRSSRTNIWMEVLALGPMFGRDWFSNNSMVNKEAPYHMNATYTEKQLLLNIATQIHLTTGLYTNFSVLYLEGLYDQHVGKMYLIGCRDVRAPWKVLYESMDLEDGLDCLIEVVISYPPTTARWLVNPSATIAISSKRVEDDPLYFQPFNLKTLPILYRQQRTEILSRRDFEGILRILTLSLAISCILSQLFYTRLVADSLPYMSLVMLGSQVIGYGLPLVIGAKVLFQTNNIEDSEMPSDDLENSQWISVIDYAVKFLVLTCFIITLRLCQMVWQSRSKLLSQNRNEPHRIPTDKRVFVITLIIHVMGYIFALIFHSVKTGQNPVWMEQYVDAMGNPHTLQTWGTLFQEYIGVLQDLFLLPQVIGNIVWQINGKPLRKLYYLGITIVRVLPHVYDYIRGPISNPFFSEEYEFVNPKFNFYSEFGDLAIPVFAIVLAVIVYIQQRWNYEKLSNTVSLLGWHRLLPFRSRMYEKLPSQPVEAELVSGSNKSAVQDTRE